MENEKFVSSKKAREILGVSLKTLYRWDKNGKIKSITNPSGRKRYNIRDLQIAGGINTFNDKKEKICYCRVSSKKQMDDLDRQKNFFKERYPDYNLVADIGSGINWKRKGLKTILERAMQGRVSEIVVAHRDRLCRFSFELLEWIFEKNGVKLLVLDEEKEKSKDEELADDILSIIHVYSCRKMGSRRYSNKKNKNISKQKTEKNIKTMDGNKKICI